MAIREETVSEQELAGLNRHRSMLEVSDSEETVAYALHRFEEAVEEILETFEGQDVRLVLDVYATEHFDPLAVD